MALPPIQQRLQELRSQTQTPTQPPSQNGGVRVPIQERIAQLRSQQKVEPTIEEQKQALREQGQAVSVRSDRAEPTLAGGIIREIVKQPLKAALSVARPIVGYSKGVSVDTNYLGNVGDYGTEIQKDTQQLAQKYKQGDISLGRAALGGIGAGAKQAMDLASVVPVGQVGSIAKAGIASKTAIPTLKTAARKSLIRSGAIGAGYDVSGQLASGEQYKPMQTVGAAALSTVLDFGLTKALPEGVEFGKKKFSQSPEVISSKVDNEIANIFKGTTGDVDKIRESSFKARKGIELLNKESPNIKIPDENAPLGTRVTKPFNPATAKPNELLSGVKEMDNLIVSKMKKATEDARSRGFEVNTNDAKLIVQDAIENGDIPKASGERMLKQLDSIGNDPVKAHDWVQDVNMKYKKKYERGTIEDTALGSLADDVAQVLREKLDLIVDRKGYAEAFGNNQELKRMLVAIAKKANKQVNWGDITTDSGLDAAISILTGNPAYMARTVATGVFKNIWNKFRNNAGLRSFRKAVEGTSKIPTDTRLPFSVAKPKKAPLGLPEGRGVIENNAGIQLKAPKTPTTFEPRAKVVGYSNSEGNLNQRYNSTTTASKTGISKVSREIPKKSITKQVVKTEPKGLPKAISTLEQEAKKYKSAEEFVKAYKKIPDYAMSHRPTQSGSGYNIDEFGNAPDFYKNPRFFKYSSDGTYDESISALLKIKDKPEATVTIYRASPQNDLNFGDWVSLSKKYAKQASLSEGTEVHSFKVKAKDIQFAGDDINEFGYYPTDETIKEKWFSLQPKTNNPKDYKNANDFIDAMYEKGVFKNIESSQKRWEKEMELEEIWKKSNKSPLPKAK